MGINNRRRRKGDITMTFHWEDGWYFERLTSLFDKYGFVRIYHIPENETIADVDIEIDSSSWASIVSSVSLQGENNLTFNIAEALHGH